MKPKVFPLKTSNQGSMFKISKIVVLFMHWKNSQGIRNLLNNDKQIIRKKLTF